MRRLENILRVLFSLLFILGGFYILWLSFEIYLIIGLGRWVILAALLVFGQIWVGWSELKRHLYV
jgi:hypothetical protein